MIYKRGEDIGRGEKQPASSRRCEGGEGGGKLIGDRGKGGVD